MSYSRVLYIFIMLTSASEVDLSSLHPLSIEYTNYLNSINGTWIAGSNFDPEYQMEYITRLLGVLIIDVERSINFPMVTYDKKHYQNLPESFDSRQRWSHCTSLNDIRDQGSCGSCWANAAAEVMTDRYCIHSQQNDSFYFSANDIMSCCQSCGNGCHGGDIDAAFIYWKKKGIVSGGPFNSTNGCSPYPFPHCSHTKGGKYPPCRYDNPTPKCHRNCMPASGRNYTKDKRRAKKIYAVFGEHDMKADLYKNGPLAGGFAVYEDFLSYKSGVYQYKHGAFVALHAVKILGWGVEKGTKYWLVANSFNEEWGEKGFFKILRGENHCGIESRLSAGLPLYE